MNIARLSLILGLLGLAAVTTVGGDDKKSASTPRPVQQLCPKMCMGDMGGVFPHVVQICEQCPTTGNITDTRAHSCIGNCPGGGSCGTASNCPDPFNIPTRDNPLGKDGFDVTPKSYPKSKWKEIRKIKKDDPLDEVVVKYVSDEIATVDEVKGAVVTLIEGGATKPLQFRVFRLFIKENKQEILIALEVESGGLSGTEPAIAKKQEVGHNQHYIQAERDGKVLHLFSPKENLTIK